MVDLSRTVRFCLNGSPAATADGGSGGGRHNTFAAWPAMRGLGRYYELHVTCRGEVDPVTGYFMNIKVIDEAVRDHVLPYLNDLVDTAPSTAMLPLGRVMQDIVGRLQPPLDQTVQSVRLSLTPTYDLTIRSDDMSSIVIRQQYEFSAAHRLHVDALSDEENRRVFGKCNNPSGHGHNYRLEVAVHAPIDEKDGHVARVDQLDAVVDAAVIDQLDHKHLNVDVPQFADLNPSVEHIARVIYEMLEDKVRTLGVELVEVRVWETGKTVCTYSGDGVAAGSP